MSAKTDLKQISSSSWDSREGGTAWGQWPPAPSQSRGTPGSSSLSPPHSGQHDHDHLFHGVLVQVLRHPVQHEEVGGAEKKVGGHLSYKRSSWNF